MDADYARNAVTPGDPHFVHALFVLASVMSAVSPGRAVCDAGLKSFSFDSGLPIVHGRVGVSYAKATDEHGVLEISGDAVSPKPCERVWLVPGHCDPTVNLYDWYVCVRGGRVEALWPVSARGAVL